MKRAGILPAEITDARRPRDRASQVSRATLGLRELLLRGALRPGRRISEIPLSAKLGVSRTPLRLAFERLEHEGLVYALPRTGFAPREFSLTDIWNAIEARGILEGAAARLAAERLSNPARLEPLHKIRHAMVAILARRPDDFTEYLDLNEALHVGILDLAENDVLRRALEQIYKLPFATPSSRVLLSRTLPMSGEILPVAEEQHRAILDAIEHREGARAESLGREHARLTRRHLEAALSDRSFIATLPGARLVKMRAADRR